METASNNRWMNGKNILVVALGVAVMYLTVTSIVDARFQEIEKNSRALIASQQTLLTAIAETTARNGADSVTESIVLDCNISERSDFDDLLGRLNTGLNKAELTELERLFGRCGSFFSERKSVMVARLAREIEIYENYVSLLGVLLNEDLREEFMVDTWLSLATEEKKQSELFAKLVTGQDQIISILLQGYSASSPEIAEVLREVAEISENLQLANTRVATERAKLISL